MKKLIIDMDDVICERNFIDMVNDFLKSNYEQEEIGSYYINDIIPKEKMKEWIDFFANNNVYEYGRPCKDSFETIEKLNHLYDIYIVSAYIFRDDESLSGKCLKDKFDYLYKNLPFIDPKKFIFANNKELIKADIRIDDSLKNLTSEAEIKLLYTAYHNKNITDEELKNNGITRVNSWKEIYDILK